MMNVQHGRNCGHCEQNGVACAMFLCECGGVSDETPFYLCFSCVREALTALATANVRMGQQNVANVEADPVNVTAAPTGKVRLGSALLCATCLYDPCRCVQP